jgi:beta-lactam-binding protein with PASTA domain
VVILVLALVAGALLAFRGQVFTPSHPMPALVNATLTKARADVSRVHFTLNVQPGVKSITVPAGAVVSQSPKPGTSLKEGSTVSVVPSLGKPSVSIPSLTGLTCATATAALQAAHLQGVCAPAAYSSTIASGVLILWSFGNTQDPTSAPYGSKIALVPSQGHAPIGVPNIPAGYTYDQAAAALQAVGLGAANNPVSSATVPAGQVVSTSPASGAPAPYGSTVTVNVSTGPATIPVPNIIGETVAAATATLGAQNLVVAGVKGNPGKKATGSSPATGTQVKPGSSVYICTTTDTSVCSE